MSDTTVHSPAATPLTILLAGGQPDALGTLSRFLESAGYLVAEAGDAAQALAAWEARQPQLALIDWDLPDMRGLELCQALRKRPDGGSAGILVLKADPRPTELREALQAGADDFLARPVVHAELLSRLRAAARLREFDFRMASLACVDRLTGLPAMRPFLDLLAEQARRRDARPGACILADLDYFGRINRFFGLRAGDHVLQLVGRFLAETAAPGAAWHRLYGNRFGLVWAASADDAADWADETRRQLAQLEIEWDGQKLPLTATWGVAASAETCEGTLREAEEALALGKRTGRNRVVGRRELETISQADGAVVGFGDALRHALARHVIGLATTVFHVDELSAAVLPWMRASGQKHVPVVGDDGVLAGLVHLDELAACDAAGELSDRPVGEIMARDVQQFDEDATVQTLYDYFRGGNASRVEIVCGGRPVGHVTRDALAALGETITQETFRYTGQPCVAVGGFLAVGDLEFADA